MVLYNTGIWLSWIKLFLRFKEDDKRSTVPHQSILAIYREPIPLYFVPGTNQFVIDDDPGNGSFYCWSLIHFMSPEAVIHKILKKFVMLLIGFRKFNSNLLENSSRKKLQYITVNNLKWINLIFNRNQVF